MMPRLRLDSLQRSELERSVRDLEEQEPQLAELVELNPDMLPLLETLRVQKRKAETLLNVMD